LRIKKKMNEIKEIIEKKHPGKLFLSIREASELLGLNVDTIYNRRSKKQDTPFTVRKLGGKKMVAVSEIIRLAE
jgi:hypothetical protein